MHSDNDIVPADERNRTLLKRRSRRELEKNMTSSMLQAERDIAEGWQRRAGHLGYGSTDLNRVRGALHEIGLSKDHHTVKALLKWIDECLEHHAAVVLDISAFAMTVSDVSERRGIHPQTVTRRFYAGLCCYCSMMGWPALTIAQYRKLQKC